MRLGSRMPGCCVVVAFSSHVRILEECSTINSLPVHLKKEVEIRMHTLIPLRRPGSVHSGSGSRDDCG